MMQTNVWSQHLLIRLLEQRLADTGARTGEQALVLYTSSIAAYFGKVDPNEHGVKPGAKSRWFRGVEWFTYADTKLFNRIAAEEVARRYGPNGPIKAVAVDPGGVRTHVWDKKNELTPLARLLDPAIAIMRTPAQGAARLLHVISGQHPTASGDFVDSSFKLYVPSACTAANGKWYTAKADEVVGWGA